MANYINFSLYLAIVYRLFNHQQWNTDDMDLIDLKRNHFLPCKKTDVLATIIFEKKENNSMISFSEMIFL